jgi:hypothetical protein
LLLHHAHITSPTKDDVASVDQISKDLHYFPLSLALAGKYVRVLGSPSKYLFYYEKKKAALLRRALGKPMLDEYPLSVFAAWNTSFDHLPESAKQLFHLFCFLDRTNINLDLLRRSCQTKKRWSPSGELEEVTPDAAGVPKWCQTRWTDDKRDWFELTLMEDIFYLEEMFFFQRECIAGDWIHGGQVSKRISNSATAIVVRWKDLSKKLDSLCWIQRMQSSIHQHLYASHYMLWRTIVDNANGQWKTQKPAW